MLLRKGETSSSIFCSGKWYIKRKSHLANFVGNRVHAAHTEHSRRRIQS